MIIIPDTEKYEHVKDAARISYCYLHGKLCEDVGFDIFGFQGDFTNKSDAGYLRPGFLKDGIYPCKFEDKDCLFFYWNSEDKYGRHRGLVVYSDDIESLRYAAEAFSKKYNLL